MPTSILQFREWRKRTEARLGGKCAVCRAKKNLQFDHIRSETKLFSIANIWGIADKKILEAEIKKCQLLCKPCHLVKTAAELSARFKKDRTKCHGTLSQYTRYKCRCEECRDVYRKFKREWRASKNLHSYVRGPYGLDIPHGSKRFYARGCRCVECRAANAAYVKAKRHGETISSTEYYRD